MSAFLFSSASLGNTANHISLTTDTNHILVPLRGNTLIYSDGNGGDVTDKGIENWTDGDNTLRISVATSAFFAII